MDYMDVLKRVQDLPENYRNLLVATLLENAEVDYRVVSEAYIGYLQKIRKDGEKKAQDISNLVVNIAISKTKDINKAVMNAYDKLTEMGFVAPSEEIIKKWG